MKFSFAALLSSLLVVPAVGLEDWEFSELSVKLPKPLSDHSASYSPDSGLVYLAGGCDHQNGNEWFVGEDEIGTYYCNSISNSFYSFNPEENKFEELTSLPQARYRHSSTVFGNKVWITGGRSLDDNLIADIDVYDIAEGKWETKGQIHPDFLVSDHASFAQDAVYIAGGYNASYTAMTYVLRLNETDMEFSAVGSLNHGRGDIFGVTSDDGLSAYVAGGFSHTDWCKALDSVEKYSFSDNSWTLLPAMDEARGETVLVEMDNHLYSIGGEYSVEDICVKGETIPGTKTVGTDRVEVLKDSEDAWTTLADFPEVRFRFAAVSVNTKGLIYTFGGQAAYSSSCKCFKTTDNIFIFGKEETVDQEPGADAGNHLSMFFSLLAGIISFGLIQL